MLCNVLHTGWSREMGSIRLINLFRFVSFNSFKDNTCERLFHLSIMHVKDFFI